MKRFYTTITAFFFTFICLGQAKTFEVGSTGIQPLIQEVDGITYNKVKDWVNYAYTSADDVIGSNVEGQMLRFTGIAPNYARSMGYNYDLRYTMKIELKENKYRLTVERIENGVSGIFANFYLPDYYKKNGDLRGAYKKMVVGLETELNNINLSLYDFIAKGGNTQDDW